MRGPPVDGAPAGAAAGVGASPGAPSFRDLLSRLMGQGTSAGSFGRRRDATSDSPLFNGLHDLAPRSAIRAHPSRAGALHSARLGSRPRAPDPAYPKIDS